MSSECIYQLRITLLNSPVPIWRQVVLSGECTLGDLHAVIQHAMGWEEEHLHGFTQELRQTLPSSKGSRSTRTRIKRTFMSSQDPMGRHLQSVPEDQDEDIVTLQEVCPSARMKLNYEYDFGDSWMHEILVEKIFPPGDYKDAHPRCLDGKGACPPEDCGGVWGYEHMLAVLADKDDPEYEELSEWMDAETFDPEAFDIKSINKSFARW